MTGGESMKKLKAWQVESLQRWLDNRLSYCIEQSADRNLGQWYRGKADAFQEIQDWLDSMIGSDDDRQG